MAIEWSLKNHFSSLLSSHFFRSLSNQPSDSIHDVRLYVIPKKNVESKKWRRKNECKVEISFFRLFLPSTVRHRALRCCSLSSIHLDYVHQPYLNYIFVEYKLNSLFRSSSSPPSFLFFTSSEFISRLLFSAVNFSSLSYFSVVKLWVLLRKNTVVCMGAAV